MDSAICLTHIQTNDAQRVKLIKEFLIKFPKDKYFLEKLIVINPEEALSVVEMAMKVRFVINQLRIIKIKKLGIP